LGKQEERKKEARKQEERKQEAIIMSGRSQGNSLSSGGSGGWYRVSRDPPVQRWKKGWKLGRKFPESIMIGRKFSAIAMIK
jgi:hypothetical protein